MLRDEFLAGPFAATVVPASAAVEALRALEKHSGGRLGVFAINIGSGRRASYRSGERFPMCSTFKLLMVGAVLWLVDGDREQLERRVAYTKARLLEYAPVTSKHVGAGFMTVEALCAATIEYSDNSAANLLLHRIGGPPGWTHFARFFGDQTSTLNRTEPNPEYGDSRRQARHDHACRRWRAICASSLVGDVPCCADVTRAACCLVGRLPHRRKRLHPRGHSQIVEGGRQDGLRRQRYTPAISRSSLLPHRTARRSSSPRILPVRSSRPMLPTQCSLFDVGRYASKL